MGRVHPKHKTAMGGKRGGKGGAAKSTPAARKTSSKKKKVENQEVNPEEQLEMEVDNNNNNETNAVDGSEKDPGEEKAGGGITEVEVDNSNSDTMAVLGSEMVPREDKAEERIIEVVGNPDSAKAPNPPAKENTAAATTKRATSTMAPEDNIAKKARVDKGQHRTPSDSGSIDASISSVSKKLISPPTEVNESNENEMEDHRATLKCESYEEERKMICKFGKSRRTVH